MGLFDFFRKKNALDDDLIKTQVANWTAEARENAKANESIYKSYKNDSDIGMSIDKPIFFCGKLEPTI